MFIFCFFDVLMVETDCGYLMREAVFQFSAAVMQHNFG